MGRISQRIDETVEVHDVPYRGTEPDPVAVERSGHQSAALAFARLLWEQRARLAKATVAGLVIAAVGTLLIPNRYQAVIQLMPPDGNSLSGGMGTLTALMGMSRRG